MCVNQTIDNFEMSIIKGVSREAPMVYGGALDLKSKGQRFPAQNRFFFQISYMKNE